MRDGGTVGYGGGHRLNIVDHCLNGLLDALLNDHGVGTGGYVLKTLAHNRLGEQGRGGRAVAGYVLGLGSYFLDQLGAHVLKGILKFDFAGNGHAVTGDEGCAKFLIKDDIATLRAESNLNCIS